MKRLARVRRGTLTVAVIALLSLALLQPALAASQRQAQAIAQITSPTEGQALAGLVTVTGSADHPDFQRWELAYGPDPNPNDAWQPFAEGRQPVLNGTIGTWNTGVIADGQYMLRLRVVRKDSNYDEAFVRGLKVSNSAPIGTPTSIPPAATFPAEQATFAAAGSALPTAAIMVEQPPTTVPEAPVAQNSQPKSNSTTRRTTSPAASLDTSLFGNACLNGAIMAVAIFMLVGVMQVGRWSVKQIRRSQKQK